MAYSGLETLFQNMGPTFAASMAGQREGMSQGLDTLDAVNKIAANTKLQQENAQAQVMNPLNAQFKQGEIAQQGAQLPGLVATSQSLQQKADLSKATLPSDIAKAISTNDLSTAKDKLSTLQNANTMIQQTVMAYPDGPQGEAMMAADIQSGKIPPSQAEQITRMGSLANNKAMATQLATTTNKLTESFQQAIAQQALHNEGALAQAKVGAGATVAAANIHAASSEKIASESNDTKLQMKELGQKIDNRVINLLKEPQTPQRDAMIEQLKSLALTMNPGYAAGINLGQATGGAIQTNVPAPTLGAAPTTQAPAGALAIVQQNPGKMITYGGVTKTAQQWFDEKYNKGQ